MSEQENPYMSGSYADLIDAQEQKEKKTVSKPTSKSSIKKPNKQKKAATTPRHRDTAVSNPVEAKGTSEEDVLETIRQAVKVVGKEAATYRFTAEEKDALAEVIYEFRFKHSPKITTSENEIARIAINYLLHEHRENKDHSILSLLLMKLRG